MWQYFKNNIEEIDSSPALRIYGFFLSLTHVLSFFHWRESDLLFNILTNHRQPLCWSFNPWCDRFHLSTTQSGLILWSYLFLACAGAVLFIARPYLKWAYFLSLFLWPLKWLLMIQDYRLMGNYHYMPFVLAFAFLFWPHKNDLLRLLIVSFYLSAGLLKLNPEWMTGAAIYGSPIFKGRLLELSCIYVVFLELLVSFGLLARDRRVFGFAILQFAMFHIFSWHIVGFFYPLVMMCVLSIFLLQRALDSESNALSHLVTFFSLKKPKSVYLALSFFWFAQVAPAFFPGDPALTGEGRIFALNMFDSQSTCKAFLFSHFKQRVADDTGWVPFDVGPRIRCDPLLYWNVGRSICQNYAEDPSFLKLEMVVYTKRTSDVNYKLLVNERDFCKSNPQYSIFKHNSWIRAE